MPKAACGVVIALNEEFERFKLIFSVEPAPNEPEYLVFHFKDADAQEQTGVVTVMESMGPSDARQAANRLAGRWSPRLMVSMGISGALAGWLRLGDLVIATDSDDYMHRAKTRPPARVGEDAGTSKTGGAFDFSLGSQNFRASKEFTDILQLIKRSDDKLYRNWQRECARAWPHDLDSGPLKERGLLGDSPVAEPGPVAAGDIVGAASGFKAFLLAHNRNYVALDMESAGVLQACVDTGTDGIVIRGISDPADERKQELESSTRDLVRAWAMDNACRFLSLALRQKFTFGASKKGIAGQANKLAGDLHTLAYRKYLRDPYRKLEVTKWADLTACHELFTQVATSGNPALLENNIFENLSRQIAASREMYPLRIEGCPGTGKTSFLCVLYAALRFLHKEEAGPLPVYIDLKKYQDVASRQNPVEELRNDLSPLVTLLRDFPDQKLMFLIDGIEEYTKSNVELEQAAFELIGSSEENKKIVGVGLNYHYDPEVFGRDDLVPLENPEETVRLGPNPADEDRIRRFTASLAAVNGLQNTEAAEIVNRVRQFRLGEIDLLTLSLVFESRKKQKYKNISNLSGFYHEYCREYLDATVAKTANLAYRYAIKQEPLRYEDGSPREWKLIHRHSTLKDYLVAYHLVQLLLQAGRADAPDERFEDLFYIFPQQISRFCKEILNKDQRWQLAIIRGAEMTLSRNQDHALPWVCYIAGRVEYLEAQGQARQFLFKCQKWVKGRLEELPQDAPDETRSHLLLITRTVYISLVSLGEEEASREYIQRLFELPEWDELNRAFHLEYYGDAPYLPKQRLTHRDPFGNFPNTFRSLYGRLSSEYDAPGYSAREVDLYTLLSLAQHRHVRGGLEPSQRDQLRELVARVLNGSGIKSGTLRQFLEMMQRDLKSARFSVGQIAETLYGLKTEKRKGWIDRGLLETDVESVADHTYGAYILGLLYLPEEAPKWPGYNKRIVLEMILIHDLGEAFTGDLLPRERNQQKIGEEREAYEYIGALGTYPRVGRLERVKELWQDFDQKAYLNARIANDLDKLENLFQLCLYRKGGKPVKRAAELQQDLSEKIVTAAGMNILDIIKEQFRDGWERPGESSCGVRRGLTHLTPREVR